MTLNEYKEKITDIRTRGLQAANAGRIADAEALKAEAERITAAFEAEKAAAAEAAAMNLATPATPFRAAACNLNMEDRKPMSNMIDTRSTQDYRNAFLKTISGRDLNDAEKSAYQMVNADFVHTTGTIGGLLPTSIQNEIWSVVTEQHSILADIHTLRGTGVVMEVPVHKAVTAGKAKKVAEGAANDAENNTFATIRLAGNDYSKTVYLSYAAANMAIDALESYLVREIGEQLSDEMADDTIAAIKNTIDAGNKLTTKAATYADITRLFGQLKRCANRTVYVTSNTLFNVLANLTDASGHLVYVPSANSEPNGNLLGARVRIDDGIGDGVILVGDPNRVVNNVITDVMIETDKDIKTHTYVYSGYARAEAALVDSQSFAMLTVSAGA